MASPCPVARRRSAAGVLLLLVLASVGPRLAAAPAPARLRVSDNHRFLVTGDGQPFFYLADTAWELFHRLDREQAERYLRDRAGKGFTVVQAVALAEIDGLNAPNAQGHRPLRDNDPLRPWVEEGPANDYWDHVDFVLERANALGLTIALLPSWGDKWFKDRWGLGPEVFTPENAAAYGEWIGRRYRERSVIWVLGGDRRIENDRNRAIIAAMAEGLKRGDGGAHLMTFHPTGGEGSAQYWHEAPWLDLNFRQNGHQLDYPRYGQTLVDYRRSPAKPVIDAEPVYEDHPVDFNQAKFGHTVAADVRRPLYWDLFNGACGHTYGHHSVWQMFSAAQPGVNDPLMHWDAGIAQPGAGQMQYGRWLIESRPILTRIPDPDLLVAQTPKTAWPGEGRYRFVATRDESGSYAMIYAPVGRPFTVRLGALSGTTLRAWWFNPRDGTAQAAGEFARSPEREFVSPTPGELLDWVLVLDDASRNFPAPGTRP